MANALVTAALEYEKSGYSVIPLKPKDKIPLIPSWSEFQVERADREQLGTWWRTWPNANIGIVTGAVSGICVIDCDSPEAAANLKPILGDMTNVGIVATGKGFHLYYARGAQARQNKAAIRPQIDFRGDGGYVVAPPSIHSSGRKYEWSKPLPDKPRELPAEFIALMDNPSGASGHKAPFDTAGALSGLAEGQRDQGVFKLAAKLRGADVPYEAALELCEQAAANCVPPFREARRKVDQAYKYAAGRTQPIEESFWPEPLSAQQLIDLPPDDTRWVWFECLPLRATSALIAKPYTGKSTFAASLALAVSRGIDFLGRPTQQGTVLYVYLDGPQDELKENLLNIGLCGSDPILAYAGKRPSQVVEWVAHVCKSHDVRLVVIDTAQKFFGFKEDRYEEKINAMQPMLNLAQESDFHAMFTYHAAKNSANTVSALGSVASEANARVSLYLRKKEDSDIRIFDTAQNTGKKFEQIGLSDPKDGFLTSIGALFTIEIKELSAMVINELVDTPAITEADLRERLQCRKSTLMIVLKKLRETNRIERTGVGIKGAPFKYYKAGDIIENAVPGAREKVIKLFGDNQ